MLWTHEIGSNTLIKNGFVIYSCKSFKLKFSNRFKKNSIDYKHTHNIVKFKYKYYYLMYSVILLKLYIMKF